MYTWIVLAAGAAALAGIAVYNRPKSIREALRQLFPLNVKIGVTVVLVAAMFVVVTSYATPQMALP